MRLMHFHTLRSGVQANASPATGSALVGMERLLHDTLSATGCFPSVEVGHTDDPDQLVVALCQYRSNLSEEDVAALVDRLWQEKLCFGFWEVHATQVEEGHVEFEGATREGRVGHYVTVHLVAQRSPVPAQRGPQPTGSLS
jgi:hypothetical protein